MSTILLLCCLIYLSYKDLKESIIPDILLLALALLGFYTCGFDNILSVVVLGGIGYCLYRTYPLLRGEEGLGFGDVKMMAVSGLWLDTTQIPLYLFISGCGGVILALLYKQRRFPLGPALALSLGICILGENVAFGGKDNMTTQFSGPTLQPASGGKPNSIVVFIHGYGSDGHDLIELGKAWASILPDTLFAAPHGPTVSEQNPEGKQWFGLRDWNPPQILKEVQALTPSFNRYLDDLLKANNLTPDKLAIVGFSQGAMLALHIGLHRPMTAGVVAYSGAFLYDPSELMVARPPVLLVHGTDDQVLPVTFSQHAEQHLKALNIPTTYSELPGLQHGIDGRALGLGGAFLKEKLYGESTQQ
jgi:phospholipase/carboxylesterase